jgi:hypothetical protein
MGGVKWGHGWLSLSRPLKNVEFLFPALKSLFTKMNPIVNNSELLKLW